MSQQRRTQHQQKLKDLDQMITAQQQELNLASQNSKGMFIAHVHTEKTTQVILSTYLAIYMHA